MGPRGPEYSGAFPCCSLMPSHLASCNSSIWGLSLQLVNFHCRPQAATWGDKPPAGTRFQAPARTNRPYHHKTSGTNEGPLYNTSGKQATSLPPPPYQSKSLLTQPIEKSMAKTFAKTSVPKKPNLDIWE